MKRFWFDLLLYLLLPMIIWNAGMDALGEYNAILLSTIPGLIYGIFSLVISKQFNSLGVFILMNLLIGGLVNLFSGSMENMLRNQMSVSIGMALMFVLSFIIKRPLPLYFITDISIMMGYKRKESLQFFRHPELYSFVLYITLLFIFQHAADAVIKGYFLFTDGAVEYTYILLMLRISTGLFFFINGVLIVLLTRKIKQFSMTAQN